MSKPVKWIYGILNLTVLVMLVLELFNRAWYNAFLCALTMILFTLPFIIGRRMKIRVPTALEIIALLFIFAAEILGELRDYYAAFPYWDKMLHTINGFLCAAIGLALINILNDAPGFQVQMSPVFVAFFAFCFSMTVGVLWEFLEYFSDTVLQTNMQKDTLLANGILEPGLHDTMGDLIVNFIGAVAFSFFGYFYIKRGGKGRIIPYLLLTRENGGEVPEPQSAIQPAKLIVERAGSDRAGGVDRSGATRNDVGDAEESGSPRNSVEAVVGRQSASDSNAGS
ncbi:MAG: hypothetical protein LBC38_03765 [Oscillospiraceae bacterium]|jgi:uncharacterized membrane protein YjdF|nr:hypothetical protein [Oscillospiraceae bacterium]